MSGDSCYLLYLPPEMHWNLLQFLDTISIFHLYRTSKSFAALPLLAHQITTASSEDWKSFSASAFSPRELGLYWNRLDWPIQIHHNQLRYDILSDLLSTTKGSSEKVAAAIAQYQQLDETFIIHHAELLPMDIICQHQVLSEIFIIHNIGILPWEKITIYQNLSDWFFRHFETYIPWECLYENKFLSDRSKAELLKFHAMCEMERSVEEYNNVGGIF